MQDPHVWLRLLGTPVGGDVPRSLRAKHGAIRRSARSLAPSPASIVVIGAVVAFALITFLGKWRYLWTEWLTSLDHKKIGIMYIVFAFVMLTRALIEAVLMRAQQAFGLDAPAFCRRIISPSCSAPTARS